MADGNETGSDHELPLVEEAEASTDAALEAMRHQGVTDYDDAYVDHGDYYHGVMTEERGEEGGSDAALEALSHPGMTDYDDADVDHGDNPYHGVMTEERGGEERGSEDYQETGGEYQREEEGEEEEGAQEVILQEVVEEEPELQGTSLPLHPDDANAIGNLEQYVEATPSTADRRSFSVWDIEQSAIIEA